MAPFLRDEGPPVSQQTIQRVRESLPLEYGYETVNETGREVLVVRVPKAKPDYLHDLGEVAFYVSLDLIKNTKDVLLVGHEKTARLEPQLLRDHIRAQAREDAGVVDQLRRQLGRDFGTTFVQSPSNHSHQAFTLRIPKESVAEFSPDDVKRVRDLVQSLKGKLEGCQYAYIVAQRDFERIGRRILFELIGLESQGPAPAPAAPAPLPAHVAPAAPAPAPAARPSFPRTPAGGAPPGPAPAPAMAATAGPVPSIFASAIATNRAVAAATPAPAPAPTPSPSVEAPAAAPEPAHEVTVHEEYEIVTKPKAPAAPAPAPAPAPVAAPVEAPAAGQPQGRIHVPEGGAADVHEEYEIVSTPKAAPAPAPAASAAHADHSDRKVMKFHEEYEVFTSKPKPKPEPVGITPPGQGGFNNIFNMQQQAHAPAKTKEYEIMGRSTPVVDNAASVVNRLRAGAAHAAPQAAPAAAPAPQHVPAHLPGLHYPNAAPAVPAPVPAAPAVRDDPRVVTPRTALPVPAADSGAAVIPRVAPAAPELVLAQRFRESGYEVVEGLRAQGTVFAFAAHRPNGRRVLVKRAESFGPDEAATLAQLVAALGADVALVVADRLAPGTRLATWGTRIEVATAADVPGMQF